MKTGTLLVKYDNDDPATYFVLGVQHKIEPRYLIDDAWKGLPLV